MNTICEMKGGTKKKKRKNKAEQNPWSSFGDVNEPEKSGSGERSVEDTFSRADKAMLAELVRSKEEGGIVNKFVGTGGVPRTGREREPLLEYCGELVPERGRTSRSGDWSVRGRLKRE